MISCQDVSKVYTLSGGRQVTAVERVSLEVAAGEFLVITGRSGSGKTTLLNLTAGLARPTSGRALMLGEALYALPDAKQSALRSQKVGFIFQFPSLIPTLNVLENVMLPTALIPAETPGGAEARAVRLLEEVGLADKLTAFPRQLSAGQQQRVVIARALVNQPEVLLADEPTSNLDDQTEHEIMALLKQFHTRRGITVMLVTHANDLITYGTRAVRMNGGRLEAAG